MQTQKPFDPTKPVQKRDGRKARIICTDRKDPSLPIVAAYAGIVGDEGISCHRIDGLTSYSNGLHPDDLVNIPVRREGWVNIYPGMDIRGAFESERLADMISTPKRIACVRIEWEES